MIDAVGVVRRGAGQIPSRRAFEIVGAIAQRQFRRGVEPVGQAEQAIDIDDRTAARILRHRIGLATPPLLSNVRSLNSTAAPTCHSTTQDDCSGLVAFEADARADAEIAARIVGRRETVSGKWLGHAHAERRLHIAKSILAAEAQRASERVVGEPVRVFGGAGDERRRRRALQRIRARRAVGYPVARARNVDGPAILPDRRRLAGARPRRRSQQSNRPDDRSHQHTHRLQTLRSCPESGRFR